MYKLNYVAVSTDYNALVNRYYQNVLYNPARQNFDRLMEFYRLSNSVNFGDSGGFQIANCEIKKEKRCIVKVGAGIQNKRNLCIIDPIDLCRQYGKLEIKYGFTLDYPLWEEANHTIFSKKLADSYKWANYMFHVRNQYCPNTEFLIPLHFFTKDQLDFYYQQMSSLGPEGFAIPASKIRGIEGVKRVSYSLAFLHHKGIKKIHVLGASNRVFIGILAAAIGQKMFEMISFDSRTWNNANKPFKKDKSQPDEDYFYINPITLQPQNIIPKKTAIKHFLPPRLKDCIVFNIKEEFSKAKDKIYFYNAFAIRRYARRLAEKADDIPGFMAYLPEAGFDVNDIKKASIGINILKDSITKGFDYVEQNVSWEQ